MKYAIYFMYINVSGYTEFTINPIVVVVNLPLYLYPSSTLGSLIFMYSTYQLYETTNVLKIIVYIYINEWKNAVWSEGLSMRH